MRLIDADEFIKFIHMILGGLKIYMKDLIEIIDEQPTAYNIDKVVEQLELNSKLYSLSDNDCEFAIPLNIAINIVKKGDTK